MLHFDLKYKQFVTLKMISEINNWINRARCSSSTFWRIRMFTSGGTWTAYTTCREIYCSYV